MKEYSNIPHFIRAVRFDGDITIHPALLRAPGENQEAYIIQESLADGEPVQIKTTIHPGDYLAEVADGGLDVCPGELFPRLYECVEAPTDPVAETKLARRSIRNLLFAMAASPRKSRSRSLAVTKLEEASMWLGKDLQELNEPNPYPNSHNPESPVIDPTAPEACALPKQP